VIPEEPTAYERQCRRLLKAFPADFRSDRGDDLIVTLLDDAPGAGNVSLATAANLVAAGTRMRARRAGADLGVRRGVAGGFTLAAVVGLGLQAALAVATAVWFWQYRVVFYLFLPQPASSPSFGADSSYTVGRWIGADSSVTWIVLAVVCAAAFVLAVRGRVRVAAMLSTAATAYTVAVAAIAIHASNTDYMAFAATPGLVAVGAVASVMAVIVAGRRHSNRRGSPRTWWWLAAAAGLAAVFVAVGDGSGAQFVTVRSGLAAHRTIRELSMSYPPQGGVLTALQYLWGGGVLAGLVWSRLDPRIGWATAVLSLPFLAYQLGALTFGASYYDHLYQPWWQTGLALMAAGAAIAALTANAAIASRSLRRQ
jgi:hypothetical protein